MDASNSGSGYIEKEQLEGAHLPPLNCSLNFTPQH